MDKAKTVHLADAMGSGVWTQRYLMGSPSGKNGSNDSEKHLRFKEYRWDSEEDTTVVRGGGSSFTVHEV